MPVTAKSVIGLLGTFVGAFAFSYIGLVKQQQRAAQLDQQQQQQQRDGAARGDRAAAGAGPPLADRQQQQQQRRPVGSLDAAAVAALTTVAASGKAGPRIEGERAATGMALEDGSAADAEEAGLLPLLAAAAPRRL